jgi:hypothetical protein
MADLEPLARELRAELGGPPDAWLERQRARLRRSELAVTREPRALRGWAFALAATVALTVLAIVMLRHMDTASEQTAWLVADAREKPHRLADGSVITLDAGARARVVSSSERTRVDLHAGRAHFSVEKRAGQRFTVAAGRYEVAVVGTRFSVDYRPPTDACEVHVEHGAVSVTAPNRAEPIALQAGDRLRLGPSEVALEHGKPAGSVGTRAPASPSAASMAAAEPTPAPAVITPPVAELDWRELYRARKYRAALARAKELGFDRLTGELPAAALADLADTARLGGESALAIRALGALGRRFPESNEAREANFLLGRVHALRGEVSLATHSFERYLSASGPKAYESEAMGRLLELYAKGSDRSRAENMARRYLQRSPDGAYRRLAHSLLGTTAPSAASATTP